VDRLTERVRELLRAGRRRRRLQCVLWTAGCGTARQVVRQGCERKLAAYPLESSPW